MLTLTCSCGRSTQFRDGLDAVPVCVFCGSRLDPGPAELPPRIPIAPLPDRPAELYIVQSLIAAYLIATAFAWKAAVEATSDLARLPVVIGGAAASAFVWIALSLGLRWRARWARWLAVAVFSSLLAAGVVLAARLFLFNREGTFNPQSASVHGLTCASSIVLVFTASFGLPLGLILSSWRRL